MQIVRGLAHCAVLWCAGPACAQHLGLGGAQAHAQPRETSYRAGSGKWAQQAALSTPGSALQQPCQSETASVPRQGLVTVGAVDCDEEGNKPLCGRYGVQGFPTIKVFGPDKQMNPYTKKVGKTRADYNGARRCSASRACMMQQEPGRVRM